MKKRTLVFVLSALVASACSDEDSTQCNPETGSCETTTPPENECKPTEHFFAGKCESDDVTHCGTHTNDCTKTSGWKSGNCYEKTCLAEKCETGYHLDSHFDSNNNEITSCEEDTHDACGSINTKCGADEVCTNGKCQANCKPGEVICGGSCINPMTSKNYCGADASCSSYITCSEFEDCINSKCVQSSCQNAQDVLCTENGQSVCVNIHGNNPNHCGGCGVQCNDMETAKAIGCADGKCIYSCNYGMTNCGSTDNPLCLDASQMKTDSAHCGSCSNTCKSNEYCENGQCKTSSCDNNQCSYNDTCVNTNDHCGTSCKNCNTANYASAGTCQNGTCKITSCITGYHLTSNGTCEIDSATACPNGKASGTVNCNTIDEYTKAGTCVEAQCHATECQTNAHLKNGVCIADSIQKCGTAETNCTQLAGWNTGKCENGQCVATKCKSGYCLNSMSGLCTNEQSISACGINGNACISCNQNQVCTAGECVAKQCEGNVCKQTSGCMNDNTHCGSGCQNCSTFTSNAISGICDTSNGTCMVTNCNTEYHVYNNACEADSVNNCGAHGNKCQVQNAQNNCNNGICTFTCDSGYHKNGEFCEKDLTCDSGYHIYNNSCEIDDNNNCGSHGNKCQTPENGSSSTCTKGKCKIECKAGYHLDSDRLGDFCADDNFIMVWDVGKTYNNSTGYYYGLSFSYLEPNCKIDWGDGKTTTSSRSHIYGTTGRYTVTVMCNVSFYCTSDYCGSKNGNKLIEIKSYGGSYGVSFEGAAYLEKLPTRGTPKVKVKNSMSHMFDKATKFNQDISFWDTSNITDMSYMFNEAKAFNQPLNNWDTSSVTNMSYMFTSAAAFNQPLNNWDTSSVTDMSYMFYNAYVFNSSLNNWDTSSVTNMSSMFIWAKAFNQPLNNWDTSSVTNMSSMFDGATAFKQPLNNWDTSNVTNMSYMFNNATAFNQPLNNWDTSSVTNMSYMFNNATASISHSTTGIHLMSQI